MDVAFSNHTESLAEWSQNQRGFAACQHADTVPWPGVSDRQPKVSLLRRDQASPCHGVHGPRERLSFGRGRVVQPTMFVRERPSVVLEELMQARFKYR